MARFIAHFLKDRSGATAIEYGLIGVLVAVAIITGATAVGTAANAKLQSVSNSVTSAGS